jgi:hypothetical protein
VNSLCKAKAVRPKRLDSARAWLSLSVVPVPQDGPDGHGELEIQALLEELEEDEEVREALTQPPVSHDACIRRPTALGVEIDSVISLKRESRFSTFVAHGVCAGTCPGSFTIRNSSAAACHCSNLRSNFLQTRCTHIPFARGANARYIRRQPAPSYPANKSLHAHTESDS